MVVFGIDEAGKGPVLGPMVAASVIRPPADRLASRHGRVDGRGSRQAVADPVRFARRVARILV